MDTRAHKIRCPSKRWISELAPRRALEATSRRGLLRPLVGRTDSGFRPSARPNTYPSRPPARTPTEHVQIAHQARLGPPKDSLEEGQSPASRAAAGRCECPLLRAPVQASRSAPTAPVAAWVRRDAPRSPVLRLALIRANSATQRTHGERTPGAARTRGKAGRPRAPAAHTCSGGCWQKRVGCSARAIALNVRPYAHTTESLATNHQHPERDLRARTGGWCAGLGRDGGAGDSLSRCVRGWRWR